MHKASIIFQENNLETCSHSAKERALTGTWTTEEINLALKKEYTIEKVHNIWHYPLRSKNVFKDYILHFLKAKVTYYKNKQLKTSFYLYRML